MDMAMPTAIGIRSAVRPSMIRNRDTPMETDVAPIGVSREIAGCRITACSREGTGSMLA